MSLPCTTCHVPALPAQALSVVLNVNHFPFVIEVACWAAKREFLKLEKWVTDKIKEHHVSSGGGGGCPRKSFFI